MQVNYVHLCDYATISKEGKLSILGIFSAVRAPGLPYRLPQMFIAFELEASASEVGRPFKIEIRGIDADGGKLLDLSAEMTMASAQGRTPRPGERPTLQQAIGISALTFKRKGGHQFSIFINGDLKKEARLEVVLLGGQTSGAE